MTLSFHAQHPVFAAEVRGIDLASRFDEAEREQIEHGLAQYGVLVFRDQSLSEAAQMALGERFGPIEGRPADVGESKHRLADRRMNDISNLDPDGNLLAADATRRLFNLGNRLWHTDSSFKPVGARYSMLYGHRVPEQGGDTEFADMRHAWDRLDPTLQAKVLDMVTGHSLFYSRARLGFDGFNDEDRALYQPVRHRLVRRHPRSQRLSLYLAAHIGTIEGLPRPEAMVLIDELIEHATRREYVYRHRWRAGDLVIWDNRCTMHRATAFDDKREPRDLRRVTVQDDLPTLDQPR